MTWAIRSSALAAGAAALLSSQAVFAAPTTTASPAVDPLVSLSVLGTAQSRAAVCGSTSAAGAMSGAVFQDSSGNCSITLAMASAPAAATAAGAAAVAQDYPAANTGPHIGVLPLVIGLGLIIAAAIAITSGGSDSSGNLTPVSPQ